MLYAIVGDKGSGKTLTAVRLMHDAFKYVVTDIKVKNFTKGSVHQLKWDDLIKDIAVEQGDKIKMKKDINWDFFTELRKNKTNYCICIDESHNIISSRRSMSSTNILFSKFISQIRKVLADDSANAMIVITQALRKIDIDTRELCDLVMYCKSKYINKRHYIIVQPMVFEPELDDFRALRYKYIYRAEKYYKYYDRLALNTLSEGV